MDRAWKIYSLDFSSPFLQSPVKAAGGWVRDKLCLKCCYKQNKKWSTKTRLKQVNPVSSLWASWELLRRGGSAETGKQMLSGKNAQPVREAGGGAIGSPFLKFCLVVRDQLVWEFPHLSHQSVCLLVYVRQLLAWLMLKVGVEMERQACQHPPSPVLPSLLRHGAWYPAGVWESSLNPMEAGTWFSCLDVGTWETLKTTSQGVNELLREILEGSQVSNCLIVQRPPKPIEDRELAAQCECSQWVVSELAP